MTEVSGLGLPHESTGRASVASTIVHSKEYYRDLRIRTHASGHEIETEFRQVFCVLFLFCFLTRGRSYSGRTHRVTKSKARLE